MTPICVRRASLPLLVCLAIGAAVFGCSEQPSEERSQPPLTGAAGEPGASREPEPVVIGPYVYEPGIDRKDHMYIKCWASIRAKPTRDFNNSFDSIKGPAEVRRLSDLDADGSTKNHSDWTGRVTEVSAGPNAVVTLFEEADLRGRSVTIQPGEKIDLADAEIGSVGSLRIEYAP